MKRSARFLTFLAAAAALFTGCRQEEADIDLPALKVAGADLSFDDDTKKASYAADMSLTTLQLNVTANRDWSSEILWDADETPWIAVTPEKGLASDQPQRVTLTILNNAGYNRNKTVKFTIGYDYKTLAVSQTGERGEEIIGTLDNPLTVAGAVKYVKSLGADVQSSSQVFVKGKISQIADGGSFGASGTYGNATFYISDDGTTNGDQFYAYRVLYLGNRKWTSKDPDIKVGDEVILYGNVVNFRGNTPETVQGTAFVYDHNGKNEGTGGGGGSDEPVGTPEGTGTQADPYNVAAALQAVKPLTWTSNEVYDSTDEVFVKGKISRIANAGTFGESGTFGNATFYISDDGSQNGELYAYRILYLGNKKYTSGTDIKVGDEVVICGKLMNYRGNTPETVANAAYLYSLNGQGGGGTDPQPSGDVKAVTIAEFNAAPESQTQVYELVGVIGGSINTTYGNFDLTDATGTVYVYGLTATELGYGAKNDKSYASLGLAEGDKIKIRGYRGSFGDKIEVMYAWFIEKVTGDDPQPSGVKAVSIADFNAAPESDSQVYELVGTIGGSINTTYGNFDLTDATGTVYVYGLTATELGYGAKNDKSYASLGLAEGDKIKIRGYRGSFGDKIEVMYAWFIEKVTGDDPQPSGVKAVSIADFNAAPESDSQVYELVGTIGGSINTTYGNFDLTDATGTVYVYGLTATELGYGAKNDKSYASLGLAEGDKIKIRGYRGSFGDKIEVVSAWFIEKVSGGGGDTPSGNGSGTLADPYTALGAIDAVKDLTWTSNTVYDKTDKVYVKGKISRIANNGTYVGGGTFGNASYWISADGAEKDEFQIFRSLYFNGEKYTDGTDIQVGDEVIVYGSLMNYKGNTPETVANENWLYSLNGKTDGSGGGGTDPQPSGNTVSFDTNAGAQTWTAETDGTYGAGFSSTTQGVKIGYYKHTSTSAAVAPKDSEVRVYKNSALAFTAPDGKKFKKIVMTIPGTGNGQYCVDMTGLEGGNGATADKAALTVTWSGSAGKVVLHATEAQVRISGVTIEFE